MIFKRLALPQIILDLIGEKVGLKIEDEDTLCWAIEKLLYLHDNQKKSIKYLTEKMNQSWIPVTERLPELHRDVLVAVCDVNEDDASTFIDCLVDNNDRPTWSTYNGALDRVLAWMPLPDRYRPE